MLSDHCPLAHVLVRRREGPRLLPLLRRAYVQALQSQVPRLRNASRPLTRQRPLGVRWYARTETSPTNLSMTHQNADTATDTAAERQPSHAIRISNAVVQLHKEYIGRGPAKARTHLEDDLVVCVLEGGFTRAEQTLEERTGHDLVIEMRLQLEGAMKRDIIDALQAIVGRPVRSFMAASDPHQNLEVLIMALSPRPPAEAPPAAPTAAKESAQQTPAAPDTSGSSREG